MHRDIKSNNVFIDLFGIVKIGDFGVSKMIKSKQNAISIVGTPLYLSP